MDGAGPRGQSREIDRFDTEDAVYLFCLDQGRLIGAMRAVPTLMPTLDERCLSRAQHSQADPWPDVYQLSRIFVIPDQRGEHANARPAYRHAAADRHHGVRHLDRTGRISIINIACEKLVAAALRALWLEGPATGIAPDHGPREDGGAGGARRLRRNHMEIAVPARSTSASRRRRMARTLARRRRSSGSPDILSSSSASRSARRNELLTVTLRPQPMNHLFSSRWPGSSPRPAPSLRAPAASAWTPSRTRQLSPVRYHPSGIEP